jgi:hypothetical protein
MTGVNYSAPMAALGCVSYQFLAFFNGAGPQNDGGGPKTGAKQFRRVDLPKLRQKLVQVGSTHQRAPLVL